MTYDELRLVCALAWLGFFVAAIVALYCQGKREYWQERAKMWRELYLADHEEDHGIR